MQAKGDRFDFAPLESAKDLRLDYDVTLQPPKKYLPAAGGGAPDVSRSAAPTSRRSTAQKFILLGVHPYDVVAINQMDELFQQDNYDTHYMTRRNNATIIACDVARASDHVFASSMGTAVVKEGYDILLTDIGDSYVAEAATPKGEQLLAKAKGASRPMPQALKKREDVWARNRKSLNKHELKCDPAYLPKLLAKAYKHPGLGGEGQDVLLLRLLQPGLPDVLLLQRPGRRELGPQDGPAGRGPGTAACSTGSPRSRRPTSSARPGRTGSGTGCTARRPTCPQKIGGQIACVGCGRCVGACLPDIANPVSVYNRLIDDLGIG